MDKKEKEGLSKLAIKSEVKTSLEECLKLLTLAELKETAEQYGLYGLIKAKKPALISLLHNVIIERIPENYIYFTDFQEAGFNEIIENGVLEDANIVYGKFRLLYELSIAFYFYCEDKLYLSIPDEIVEAYKNLNMDELKVRKNKNQEYYKYIIALCNLYGIYEAKQFVEVYNAHHEDKVTLSEFEDFVEIMEPRQLFFSVYYDNDKNCLICSGEDEDDEFFDIYTENKDRPYYMPSKEEIEFLEDGSYERTV